MTAFVESCVETVTDSAVAIARRTRGRSHARKLVRLLADKKRVLITTHIHPDPDALGSVIALRQLLTANLKSARMDAAVKGMFGGGINAAFAQQHKDHDILDWDEIRLDDYDAILLVDVQPTSKLNPLPPSVTPLAVIDHHRVRGRRAKCAFCDIRIDVGASGSIIFSYFMEMETPIDPDLAATLLYAIETDLAGAAGQPGELDNIALSSLTLLADTRRLYKMRYVDLPQSYYEAYARALNTAMAYDEAILSHIGEIDSMEKPGVMADFLLRYDAVRWALVTAVYEGKLMLSLRTSSAKLSANDMMRRLTRDIGEGGGHRTKAGGFIALENGTPTEIDRVRKTLRRRLLRSLHIPETRGGRLVSKPES